MFLWWYMICINLKRGSFQLQPFLNKCFLWVIEWDSAIFGFYHCNRLRGFSNFFEVCNLCLSCFPSWFKCNETACNLWSLLVVCLYNKQMLFRDLVPCGITLMNVVAVAMVILASCSSYRCNGPDIDTYEQRGRRPSRSRDAFHWKFECRINKNKFANW